MSYDVDANVIRCDGCGRSWRVHQAPAPFLALVGIRVNEESNAVATGPQSHACSRECVGAAVFAGFLEHAAALLPEDNRPLERPDGENDDGHTEPR